MHRWSAFGAVVAAVAAPALPGFRALAQDKPEARQIADAVSPLPEPMREGAAVLGYRGHDLVVLRNGTNGMICLADDPAREGFHTACYHNSLEPFMERGRALRREGLSAEAADSVRLAELESKQIPLPSAGAALHSLFHDDDGFDPATGATDGLRGLSVLYLPYATEASTGISATPARDRPWLMYPGKPTAHVMIPRR
jgi:hypothetical protein